MTSSGMDISESFRPEDLSKTDFFDFVTASATEMGANSDDRPPGSGAESTNAANNNNNQPLQGFDQVNKSFISLFSD